MKRITMNIGFITNSSSCIHHFDARVLEDPEVRQFIETFGLKDGFIGAHMWDRASCSTFAVTPEQRRELRHRLRTTSYMDPGENYYGPDLDPNDGRVTVVFGDEYQGPAMILNRLLVQAAERMGLSWHGEDFN